MPRGTDIRVVEITPWFRYFRARTPMKFGGVVLEATTYCSVHAVVEDRVGRRGEGWGAIPFAHLWGWPSGAVAPRDRELVMQRTAQAACRLVMEHRDPAHPAALFLDVEQDIFAASDGICRDMGLAETQPRLNALIPASAVDAALHDAYGDLLGLSSYDTYGPEFMPDLSRWLGREFAGKFAADYLRPTYEPRPAVFHLVGGLDPLTPTEVPADAPDDGLPNAFTDWVKRDGLFCLKVKWRGNDSQWDVQRTLDVYRLAKEAHTPADPRLYLTGDTNEQCETPQYMVEVLKKLRERGPEVFDSLLYIEQPTHRDLWNHPHDFHELSRIKPVVVDESLTDLEVLKRALELGARGVALKTCKGQSNNLLFVARATEAGAKLAVQDLSCPSLALLHSVGLAARVHVIMGVEYNSRQYFPGASDYERPVHTPLLCVREGRVSTETLKGPGLGFQMGKMVPPDKVEGAARSIEELGLWDEGGRP